MTPSENQTSVIVERSQQLDLEIGDIYLFRSESDFDAPQKELWILFQDWTPQGILCESSTSDFIHYGRRGLLLPEYRYVRPATRDEVRDFSYGMALYEEKLHRG